MPAWASAGAVAAGFLANKTSKTYAPAVAATAAKQLPNKANRQALHQQTSARFAAPTPLLLQSPCQCTRKHSHPLLPPLLLQLLLLRMLPHNTIMRSHTMQRLHVELWVSRAPMVYVINACKLCQLIYAQQIQPPQRKEQQRCHNATNGQRQCDGCKMRQQQQE
jgi:hypothetical protein